MKAIHIALIGLIVVLAAVFFLFVDNREYNALVNDQKYPVEEELDRHPASISPDSVKVEGTGIEISELYYQLDQLPEEEADTDQEASEEPREGDLYLGFWYEKGNEILSNSEAGWKREEGAVQFLVKAVDEEGTTYNGETTGKIEGTFGAFQFVKIEDFIRPDIEELDVEEERELDLFFYPISKSGEPNEKALFEASVPLVR